MQMMSDRVTNALKQAIGPAMIKLLEDERVVEIMRNANGVLCIEYLGQDIQESDIIISKQACESMIRILASSIGEICNEKNPSIALKLPCWHARFQGLVPPVVEGPIFSIRKHSNQVFALSDYVNKEELSIEQFQGLIEAIKRRENIVISGGTGSGKTTLANAILAEMIKTGDRIITVEDTPELRLEARIGQQIFTKDSINYNSTKALKDILRLRPDRIILGELRDGSCLDLIKAWNTGHSGGLTTIHANSCELAMQRIESLISEVSINIPRDLISQTVNILVQVKRQGARRCISEIKRLSGLKEGSYLFEPIMGGV
ncbi:MAG: P-type conjugative transfer ATPase TrbB [Myxococcales bacterium]|nr:P-type conjugative transfer ATPase TrbB [Myxococcales bacterium]